MKQLVVTDAFLKHEDTYVLNPALKVFEKDLLCMSQSWQSTKPETPLSWLASFLDTKPAALLAACLGEKSASLKQYWVVSPYHARLTRSNLRVMPESMFVWTKQEAQAIATLLNPLIEEEGMCLHVIGDVLLLGCDWVWDVSPVDFSQVSGGSLPDRLPDGADAGRWMRLLSEIQMCLHQAPINSEEGLAIHGLWFWGGAEVSQTFDLERMPNIATRNIQLQCVLQHFDKSRNASMVVTEAEHLPMLMNTHAQLPKLITLMGGGRSVVLKRSAIKSLAARVFLPQWKGI